MSGFFSTKYFPWQNLVWFLSVVHKTNSLQYMVFQKAARRCVYGVFFLSIWQEREKKVQVCFISLLQLRSNLSSVCYCETLALKRNWAIKNSCLIQVSQYTFAMCSYREKKSEPQELMQLEGYTVDYTAPHAGIFHRCEVWYVCVKQLNWFYLLLLLLVWSSAENHKGYFFSAPKGFKIF